VGLRGAEKLPTTHAEIATLPAQLEADLEGVRRSNEPAWLAYTIYTRVMEKLRREAVEDFRIDFEDGYGVRPDAEEDAHAASVAAEVARGMRERTLPPFIGIRIKPLSEELHARSLRTLDIFLTTLVDKAGGLPPNWLLTLPKIMHPGQTVAFAEALGALEAKLGLGDGVLRFEAMVETPQLVMDADGRSALPALIDASHGRLAAAHFGTYDYTAALNITAAHQRMRHPACDFARHMMQVAYAGTGVWLSDGSTTVMPVPVHRAATGQSLTDAQHAENRASVHRAWRLHYDDVRHSLATGFYQGWDLHPAQLVTRYAAVFSFFLEGVEAAAARLRNFLGRAAQATLVGDVFDDAATGQGLLNFFLRAINSGALSEAEAGAMIDLTAEELRARSFTKILRGRRK
jgi:citrate lyase beta subunit